MKKLAIITSHPIQYNAPLFRLLSERKNIQLKVFYTWGQTKNGSVYDPDFKKEFTWDIPLLNGYDMEFVENVSTKPGADRYNGIQNKDLIERINNYNPDSLLVYGWSFKSHLQLLRYFHGKKRILFRGDSTLLDEQQPIKKFIRRVVLKWVYRHIDGAFYTGTANRNYFLKHGLKEEQLYYAPNTVDNRRFSENSRYYEEAAKQWRSQLGIQEHELVFLFAGKFESKKNPHQLIDSFKQIRNSSVRLIMTGSGVLEQQLKDQAAEDERILFLQFQNQQKMPVVYRLGDVFVLPSKGPGETWGLSVNEAMACGKPILVSDKCGCHEDLVKGNGVVFTTDDAGSLTHALSYFINHKSELNNMGMLSLQLIQQFSIEKVADAFETNA